MPKKKTALTIEERLQQALVPAEEQPYAVPENWVWVRLGAVCYASKEKSNDFSNDIKYIGLEHLEKDKGIVGFSSADKVKSTKNAFQEGQILYGRLRPYLNKHDIASFSGVCSTDILVFEASVLVANVLVNKFFNLPFFIEYVVANSKGINLPRVSEKTILNTTFPLPPLSEQQRIVERIEELFAKLDEAKERLQEVADSFAVRKAAILHKAFTGELTKQWRLENGVSDESWEDKLLGDVCTVNPKKIDAKNLDDNLEVSFVPMAAVSDVLGEIVNHEVKNLQDVRTGFTNFSKGDVIFAKITPCMENGKSAIVGPLVNDIGYGSTEFYVLRCKEELNNKYLYHMVRNTTFRAEAKAVMTGVVGQQRVPKTFLQEYQLLLPTLSEQHEIVRLIDDLLARERKAQQATEQALASIDLMKKSILARAFRGELGTNKASEASALELLRQVLS
ncbi:restriction endonuclease subunit S [Phascolarctobacterium succinatutens]|uniref:restriction endonuclease subunit S n=1 Tax=Phascolarctobacterium succinatutens TaxID=626940 RepID=UPI00248FC823|nr:restriction endonuclease subunit S [Phascolarctobacterium succinatutens]